MNRSCFLTLFAGLLALLTATPDAAAYYHPSMGRFVQRDPAGHVGGIRLTNGTSPETRNAASVFMSGKEVPLQYIDGPNLYQYVQGTPLTRRDPTGFYTMVEAADKRCTTQCGGGSAGLTSACWGVCMQDFLGPNIANKQNLYDNWIAFESASLAWMAGLPDCPCSICPSGGGIKNPDPSVWHDPSTSAYLSSYHPGAKYEMRSKAPNAFGAGQQCTYNAVGKLIKSPFGAGTADRVAAVGFGFTVIGNWVSGQGHVGHDVDPFNLAYELDGNSYGVNTARYLSVRRINQGVGGCP